MSKYIYNVKKRLGWVVLDIEEIRDNNNETDLKEGVIVFHIRDCTLSLFAFVFYLPLTNSLYLASEIKFGLGPSP